MWNEGWKGDWSTGESASPDRPGDGRLFAVASGTGSASDTPPTSSRSSEAKREKSSPSPNQEKDRNISLCDNLVDI